MVLRVHGDDLMFGGGGGVITHSPRIPQMEMMKVHIPFTFKLHESFKSTYAGKSAFYASLHVIRSLILHILPRCEPRLGQPQQDS